MSAIASGHPLAHLGWDARLQALHEAYPEQGLSPGRVLVEQRGRYVVAAAQGELQAGVAGRLRHAARCVEDYPAVGDWVLLHVADREGVIQAILPRRSRFARPARGDIPGAQVLAANVDLVLIVTSLDHDFNLRRLERYLALAAASGVEPVIVLNKADVCRDVGEPLAAVRSVAPEVALRVISALTAHGLESLEPLLEPGRTVALVGSSGVGKSTIVNALLGYRRQAVAEVRADDQRGRHTTTQRELLLTRSGVLLIDSPGMRSVGMWEAEEGLESSFADIDALGAGCRFSDCRHASEPGCAVQAAIRSGALSGQRLESRRKLERELEALERRRAPEARAEQRRNGRRMSKSVRDQMRTKYG